MESNPTNKPSPAFISPDSSAHQLMVDLLETADIEIGGARPWDMHLNAPHVPERIFADGSLGLGEAYMDGAWHSPQLDEFICRILRARLDQHVQPLKLIFHSMKARLFNLQNSKRAWKVGEAHYDLGNDFYTAMCGFR